MNGHVFQCFEERRDPTQYTKTMEALHAYAKRELKTTDLAPLFGTTMTAPVIPMPVAPVNTNGTAISELQTMILKEEIKQYVTQTKDLKANLAVLHSVAWGQCSEALKSKIKTLSGFQGHADTHDWLCLAIQQNRIRHAKIRRKATRTHINGECPIQPA